ncbi:MAG TPA: Uma2 family endonuclease [Thermoanaerobaculia bacterium]|nr:Uma2 family endonuclease [Thermoanaerobaculia bacterium]
MSVALFDPPPSYLPIGLGPYRAEDYAALPDEPRCELILGRFYLMPSPTASHQLVVFLLGRLFYGIARATGGKAFIAPLDVTLADHSVVQPDVVYVTPENLGIVGDFITGSPDLLVEVLSHGTAHRDRGEKLGLYAQSGVREYWIVDRTTQQIEFLVNRDGAFVVVLPQGATYRSPALAGVEIDLAAFWAEVAEAL